MKKFFSKKFAVAFCALFGMVATAFAEGTEQQYDTQAITDNVTDVGNALKQGIGAMVNAVLPIAVNILISAMVLGVIVLAIRWLFRIAKTSAK